MPTECKNFTWWSDAAGDGASADACTRSSTRANTGTCTAVIQCNVVLDNFVQRYIELLTLFPKIEDAIVVFIAKL